MTSCLMKKRELLGNLTRDIHPHETEVDDIFVTAPRIEPAFVQKQKVKRLLVANPNVGPIGFEINPIVRIRPAIGKRYPMVVIKRSAASFKSTRFFDEGQSAD